MASLLGCLFGEGGMCGWIPLCITSSQCREDMLKGNECVKSFHPNECPQMQCRPQSPPRFLDRALGPVEIYFFLLRHIAE